MADQRTEGVGEQTGEEDGTRDTVMDWTMEPESCQFKAWLAVHPRAVVFVTRTPSDAEILREIRLLGIARPQGQEWDEDSLEPLRGRDVVILDDRTNGRFWGWAERDRYTVGTVARTAVVLATELFAEGEDGIGREGIAERLEEMVEEAGAALETTQSANANRKMYAIEETGVEDREEPKAAQTGELILQPAEDRRDGDEELVDRTELEDAECGQQGDDNGAGERAPRVDEEAPRIEAVGEDAIDEQDDQVIGIEEEWGRLTVGETPEVEEFPLEVLPRGVADLVQEAASAIGCDAGLVAGPALVAAGGLIGGSVHLEIARDRVAGTALLLANVVPSGDDGTAALEYGLAPALAVQDGLDGVYEKAQKEYDDAWHAHRTTPWLALRPPKLETPRRKRLVVNELSLEGMLDRVRENPRGVIGVHEELAPLVVGPGGRSGVAHRVSLRKTWAGATVYVARGIGRKAKEMDEIGNPHLCVSGSLSLELLAARAASPVRDGALDSWLLVAPERGARILSHRRAPVSAKTVEGWIAIGQRLWEWRTDEKGLGPHRLRFNDAAAEEFARGADRLDEELNDRAFPDSLRGAWATLGNYAGRFALILAVLRQAAEPRAGGVLGIGPEIARDAWRLVSYFQSHTRRVRTQLQGQPRDRMPDGARLILNWIGRHPDVDVVCERDLSRNYPPSRGYSRTTMGQGFEWLARHRALRRAAKCRQSVVGAAGRKSLAAWEIHPDLRRSEVIC